MKPNLEKPDAADHAHWGAVEEAVELLHEERFHDALVELRDVIKRDATNAYAFYFLGVALFESGEIEPARDAYRACVRLAPRHLGAKVALCHVLRALGEKREAIRVGAEAYAQAPGDADVLYALGQAHWAHGDRVAARRYFEAFLTANPELEVSVEVRGILEAM